MTDWIWTTVVETALAEFVTPHRAVSALGGRPTVPEHTSYDLRSRHEYDRLIQAVYDDLCERLIEYDIEPVNSTTQKQRIRTPEQVIGSETRPGEGTCLDLALLFAAVCLERSLRPIVVVFTDHALTMVSKVDDVSQPNHAGSGAFSGGVCRDQTALAGLLDAQSHLAVECTGFAVTRTAAGRTDAGLLTFEQACGAGAAAVNNKALRFAIDPYALHRAGVAPLETELIDDGRMANFLRGVNDAGRAVHAIGRIGPELSMVSIPDEQTTALAKAFKEVSKTYDVVLDVARDWIELAVAGDIGSDPKLLSSLITGDIVHRIETMRGHCHTIRDLYFTDIEPTLQTLLADDPDLLGSVEMEFNYLIGADGDFFDLAAQVGEYIVDSASRALSLQQSGDAEGAKKVMAESVMQTGLLQRALGKNQRELREVVRSLNIPLEPDDGPGPGPGPGSGPGPSGPEPSDGPDGGATVNVHVERGAAVGENQGTINLNFTD
ncbi:MAG: hypothetical protein OES24_07920 [Acidimicrobiia bacterium]|nr:hypothetical protein [Acidimicrobiia bacterium]